MLCKFHVAAVLCCLAGFPNVYAAVPAPREALEAEIGKSLAEINTTGHPIFVSSCIGADGARYLLVVAANGLDGFQLALDKSGVIRSESQVKPASDKDDFLVEADGGEFSQHNADRIFHVMRQRPFILVNQLTLDDILGMAIADKCGKALASVFPK